jgi:uncharacterized protein
VIAGAVLLAFACWAITFGWHVGNFWIKIGLSVIAVFSYSLLWQKPAIRFRAESVMLGLFSAAILYAIFFAGHHLTPYILPGAKSQVGGIYSLGEGTSRVFTFLLLLFVTGPGEEIFWRGFLQDRLMKRWGNVTGFLVTTVIYAGVHVFSLNLMLIFAALVAGAFWGLLYLWKRDVLLQVVSHSAWSAVIFVVAPIG